MYALNAIIRMFWLMIFTAIVAKLITAHWAHYQEKSPADRHFVKSSKDKNAQYLHKTSVIVKFVNPDILTSMEFVSAS